jgi:hypothetical protein
MMDKLQLSTNAVRLIVHPLYEPGYVITRVGNVTEEKSLVSTLEFPTGIKIAEMG